jgi:hypothetical protein
MFALIKKLNGVAKLNFCKDCYSKYRDLITGEIEYLLSEPLSDWRQTETNIDLMWIKAKGLYSVVNTAFSPHENAFKKSRRKSIWNKLNFLKKKDSMRIPIIHDLKDDRWKRALIGIENYAKQLLENPKLF